MAAVVTLLAVGASAVTGCRMPGESRASGTAATGMSANQIDFWVEPSHQEIYAGETVTLTVRDQDTAGRDVRIEWNTTGGELTTERNDRIARVKFDTPGVYTITGRIHADDVVMSDSVDVTVKRVR